MSEERYFDCPQCGHIGKIRELRDHPTRPVAMDLGFCPACGREVDDWITLDQAYALFVEYGEDPDAEISKIDMRISGDHP